MTCHSINILDGMDERVGINSLHIEFFKRIINVNRVVNTIFMDDNDKVVINI